jgi:hypothetical protein
MYTSAVCAALADPERLRVFGTICRQAEGIPVAEAQQAPAGRKALTRLLSYGLVQRAGDRYIVRPDAFLRALRETEGQRAAEAGGGSPGIEGATGQVAALFSRGKLTSMPRPGRLRAELLRWLAERFEPGRTYSEPDIRRELEPLYADHVSLRRYLVDYGLLERDNYGSYWRGVQPPA